MPLNGTLGNSFLHPRSNDVAGRLSYYTTRYVAVLVVYLVIVIFRVTSGLPPLHPSRFGSTLMEW